MSRPIIYTIGHSTHPIDYFLELLNQYSITCLVDVRSIAASRFNPQFNKKSLADSLKNNNIAYLHFAEEFGARQTNPNVLDEEGRVDFGKVRKSKPFEQGIGRVREGVKKGFNIALMCAESDPLTCHRFSMVSIALKDEFEILHILKDKTVITNGQLEQQLLKKYEKKISKLDMFDSTKPIDRLLKIAYQLKNKEIGYSEK